MRIGFLDIELHKKGSDSFSQRKYLVHGWDDVLWTDNLDEAIKFLHQQMELMESEPQNA